MGAQTAEWDQPVANNEGHAGGGGGGGCGGDNNNNTKLSNGAVSCVSGCGGGVYFL